MDLKTEQREDLLHALGVQAPGQRPWRNYYCAEDGAPAMEELVRLGLMRRSHTINDGRDRYYIVTQDGAAAVGERLPK